MRDELIIGFKGVKNAAFQLHSLFCLPTLWWYSHGHLQVQPEFPWLTTPTLLRVNQHGV